MCEPAQALAGYVVLDFGAFDAWYEEDELNVAHPRGTRTYCAYKGQASYWSATIGGRVLPDIAWTYEKPLYDAARVLGLIAFFGERINVVLDGERLERPITPWSAGPEA